MKQTNNAIKFLMAQYRAIFKNANIAMFAAMAAAALAAGQAQAVDIDAWDTGLSGDMTITADNKLNITVDATKTNANGFNATITAGDSVIVGKDGTDDIAKMDSGKSGTIILNGAEASLSIGGNGKSGAVVQIDKFTGNAGKLNIGGSEQKAALEAGTILLQGATPEAPAKAGEATFPMTLTLAKSGAVVVQTQLSL